ncbi:MAG: hypothetical protein H6741_20655 [Alphaproteobacteria bacterium]|nr:hypothetical protein [Alphaproteobacteria bacterium]MCB9795120.1 hypothetical protein [Alphaproteobacteria bacterium]
MPHLLLFLAFPVLDGLVNVQHSELVPEGEAPTMTLTVPGDPVSVAAECTVGDRTHRFLGQELYPGGEAVFSWPRDTAQTQAECAVSVRLANGLMKKESFTLRYAYSGALTVDPKTAKLELNRRVLTVQATGKVQSAEVVALGADGGEVYRVPGTASGGPGQVTVRWEGATEGVKSVEVVLKGPDGAARVKVP